MSKKQNKKLGNKAIKAIKAPHNISDSAYQHIIRKRNGRRG